MLPRIDDKLDVAARKEFLQPLDHSAGWIGIVLDPHNKLNRSTILLITKGNEVVLKPGLGPIKWLEKSEGRAE